MTWGKLQCMYKKSDFVGFGETQQFQIRSNDQKTKIPLGCAASPFDKGDKAKPSYPVGVLPSKGRS
jgi:hypothetical protein